MSYKNFEIRVATVEDAAAILEIYSPYILKTAVTFEKEVPTLENFEERIREVQQMYPYLVAVSEGEIIGYSYAHRFRERAAFDWTVEVSVYVKEHCRGNGVGKALYTEVENALQKQGVTNCYACIAEPVGEDEFLTTDSPKFHKRMGYEEVGRMHKSGYKFGHWYNMLIMEKVLNPHQDSMEAIKPFDTMR